MFLAIINDTYSEVKSEMEMTRVQFEITDLFARLHSWINIQKLKSDF